MTNDKALEAARQAIRYLSHPETPWSDEQVQAVISAYLSALPGEAEVVGRIEAILEAYDADVADAWNNESGERPDLWTPEVDAPVDLLRETLASLQAMQARAEAAERELGALTYKSTQSTRCPCGEVKHTPLRNDAMGGYACLTCIDKELSARLERAEAAEARVKELEEERDALRKVISECASALPNGAFISPKASVEFMAMLPAEIASVCTALSTGGSNG
jgi:hypothetical protein